MFLTCSHTSVQYTLSFYKNQIKKVEPRRFLGNPDFELKNAIIDKVS